MWAGEHVRIPTSDEPMPNRSPTGDEVDHESKMEFMASFYATTVPDLADTVDELRENEKSYWKGHFAFVKLCQCEIFRCIEPFTERQILDRAKEVSHTRASCVGPLRLPFRF